MGGFLLRKVGAALIVVVLGEHARLRSASARCRATRRSRSAARTATRRCSPTIRHEYGLDEPLPVQYVRWIVRSSLQGDLGVDQRQLPVAHTIVTRLPITLELAVARACCSGSLIGIPAGVIAAVRRGKATDYARDDRSRSSGSRCRTSGSACC